MEKILNESEIELIEQLQYLGGFKRFEIDIIEDNLKDQLSQYKEVLYFLEKSLYI